MNLSFSLSRRRDHAVPQAFGASGSGLQLQPQKDTSFCFLILHSITVVPLTKGRDRVPDHMIRKPKSAEADAGD